MQVDRVTEELFRAVFDSTAAHLAVIDAQGHVVQANASWTAFAYAVPGSRPLPPDSATDPAAWSGGREGSQATEVAQGVGDTLRTRGRFQTDVCRAMPGGVEWFEFEVWPLTGTDQVVVRCTDVSSRRATEAALLAQLDP